MRQKHARVVVFALVAVFGAAVESAGQAPKMDVTGKWAFSVKTAERSSNPTMSMKQDGEKISGHFSGNNESDFTGTIKGNKIDIKFTVHVSSLNIEWIIDGTVDTKDTMKGKVSITGLGDGTFTAKRQ